MNKISTYTIITALSLLSIFSVHRNAYAVGSSGFENASLSTRSLARGNAVVANPEDPSTIAFNPAGLTELKGKQIYAGSSQILVHVDYEGYEGRTGEHASETVVPIPYLYTSMETPIEDLVVGFGSNSPFGLISQWSSTGNFRYTSNYSELKTMAYHGSAGYKINDNLSIGGGYTYMESGLKQAGKYNSRFASLSVFGANSFEDSTFELDAEGFGHGWNVGAYAKVGEKHSFGVFYRSRVRLEYKGVLSSDRLTGLLPIVFNGNQHLTSIATDITLPDNFTFGYRYQVNDKLDLEFDIGWTGWSSYDSTEITFGNTNALLTNFEFFSRDYEDVLSIHGALSYDLTDELTLSAGYFFYQRAANRNNMSNVNPDGNRHGASLGIEKVMGEWNCDLTYEYLLITDTFVENTVGVTNGADIDGTYSGDIHIVSAGLRRSF